MYYIVGGIAVIRSYVAASTTEENRSCGLAGLSGFQTVGFLGGPGMEERIERGCTYPREYLSVLITSP